MQNKRKEEKTQGERESGPGEQTEAEDVTSKGKQGYRVPQAS